MAPEPRLALALALAGVAAYLFTPVAIQAASRLDFFDRPRGYKGHARPIPYLGGSAVVAAFAVAVLICAGDLARTLPLVGGAGVLWAVGTVDDRRHLSPALRAGVEVALAVGLWAAGLGWDLGAGGVVDAGATVLWVLAVVNAFNLFDNMDGASSAMTVVVSGAVAILGIIHDDPWLVAAGAALAGSCLGFLPYNLARPQARIFLGDGGSMPIGFAVAALVMTGASAAAPGWAALAAGLLLVGVPALDVSLVIVSRRRKGISVLTGGRDHLTHRVRRRLGTPRAVALSLGGLQAALAAIALIALDLGDDALAAATVLAVAAGAGLVLVLEREEDRLVTAGEVVIPDAAIATARQRRERRGDPLTLGDLTLIVMVAGAALSPLAFGYYDPEAWVPIGLGVTLVGAMGAIRRPQRLPLQAWLVLIGLTGIGLVALLSASWAVAPDQAVQSANRWLVLAAIAGLALVLMRTVRRDLITVAGLATGTAVIAGIVLVRMLGSNGSDLFLGGRLHQPLGYINAEATVFIMGIWLCLAAAERREAWLAGLGMGGATAMAGLALLSQSRGAAIAAFASIVIVMIAVPGRRRRAFALAVLFAGVALAAAPLLNVYDASLAAQNGVPPDAEIRRAAAYTLGAAVLAGVIWAAAVAAFAATAPSTQATVRRGGGIVLTGIALLALIGSVASAGRVADRLDAQWTAFTSVGQAGQANAPTADAGSRLVSGAGNRYDYWRVASDAFADEPLHGLGAGNFDRAWYAGRSVPEDVLQPHSIELQVLSELGIVGGVMLGLMLAGFAAGVARVRSLAREPGSIRTVAVAGVGVPTAWLVQTSADWQHLIPGTTAVALLTLAVLVRQPERLTSPISRTNATRAAAVAGAVALAAVVAIIGATLTRQAVADHYRAEALDLLATSPAAAIAAADRALAVNPTSVRSYYAKSAALARLNRGPEAAIVLREAAQHDPTNPVTWALRGDLATRRGQTATAQKYYQEALRLNPLDPGLKTLASAAKPQTTAP